jgi:hypothetical protein
MWLIIGGLLALIAVCALSGAISSSGDSGSTSGQGGTQTDGGGSGDGSGDGSGGSGDGGTSPGPDTSSPPQDDPPEDPGVTCWDGTAASDPVSCSPLEGLPALVWAVGSYDGTPLTDLTTCTEVEADESNGQTERWSCPVGGTYVYLTRWLSAADAATVFAYQYADQSERDLELDADAPSEYAETPGTEWTGCLTEGWACTAWHYDEREFSHEVYGQDAAEVDSVYGALRVKTEWRIATSAPY